MSDPTTPFPKGISPVTRAVLGASDPVTGAVVPPLQPATTYARGPDNQLIHPDYLYSRMAAPTVRDAERVITDLEGALDTVLYSSGMAAVAAVFRTLPIGAPVLVYHGVYYFIRIWLEQEHARGAINLTLIEDPSTEAFAAAIEQSKPTLVWIETPSNPMWDIIDIAAVAELAHGAGALLAVDSTSVTPLLTRALDLGADVVFHSATKYLNGHSDVLAGSLSVKSDEALLNRLWQERKGVGSNMGAFEAWLLIRGMRTLDVRVQRSCDNAMAIATALKDHPKIVQVLYPGLPDHPGHALAAQQMGGRFSGMLSLRIAGGQDGALAFMSRLKLIARATSLGGVESLIEHRRTVEDENSPVPADLVRLSVGIEAVEDLINDLTQALDG